MMRKFLLILCLCAVPAVGMAAEVVFDFDGIAGGTPYTALVEVTSADVPELSSAGIGKVEVKLSAFNINGDGRKLGVESGGKVGVTTGAGARWWDQNTKEAIAFEFYIYDSTNNLIDEEITLESITVDAAAGQTYQLYVGSGVYDRRNNTADYFIDGSLLSFANDAANGDVAQSATLTVPTTGMVDLALVAADQSPIVYTSNNTMWIRRTGGTDVKNQLHNITISVGSAIGAAHTPTPTGSEVDSTVVNQLTWEGPLTQSDPEGDPNLVSVDQFDLTIYSKLTDNVNPADDPNFPTYGTTYTNVTSPYAIALDYDTTYFWRVDTHITWDSNEFTGTVSPSEIVEGAAWQFSTLSEYLPPVIDSFDNVITTLDIVDAAPVVLSATISGNSDPVTPTFTLLTDDFEFPTGATAILTPNYTDPQNPTATLDTDTAGTYKVKLEVVDGTTTLEQIAEVAVYTDTCQAKKDAPSAWVANEYDKDGDCIVGMTDFAKLALEWLDDTGLLAQETYDGGDILALDADFYVEAEDPYSLTDANYVTEAPLEVDAGAPRINTTKDWVNGGAFISHTEPNDFITYEVNIPESGDYTVMLYNAFPSGDARSAALGAVTPDGDPSNDDIYAYGEILLSDGTDWNGYKIDSTTVNFTAGTHLVRLTWIDGDFSVDFIAFKKE